MKVSTRMRVGRIFFLIFSVIFASCVTVQIFIAGMAVFVDPVNWVNHHVFAHLFGFNLPVIMVIMALAAGVPRRIYFQLFGVFATVFLMYFSANITAQWPWMGAVHPVIALVLFLLSCLIVVDAWRLIANTPRVRNQTDIDSLNSSIGDLSRQNKERDEVEQ